jgi:hypothetical protein
MQKKLTTLLQHGTALSLNRRYDTGEKQYMILKEESSTIRLFYGPKEGNFNA